MDKLLSHSLPDVLELNELCHLVYPTNKTQARRLAANLEAAMAAGKLKATVKEERRVVGRTSYSPWVEGWNRPPDIRYAIVRRVLLHRADFRAYIESEGLPPADLPEVLRRWVFPEAPAEEPPTPKPIATDRPRTRQDNLTKAIMAALPVLRDRLKRNPSTDELFDYLEQHDATEGTGTVYDTKTDILIWKDEAGIPHETNRRALAKRLKELLKRVRQ